MFISVDLPAPFSPSSACTSPRRRSKSTWSLARTPGKVFVIPRSSSTGRSASIAGDSTSKGGLESPPFDTCKRVASLLEDGRRLELALHDLRPERVDLPHHRRPDAPLQLRADLAERDAVVLQVEDEVRAALELVVLRVQDGVVDPDVHPLYRAREDVGAEVGLVLVDADPPDPGFLRGVERAVAARTRDGEDDLRARLDLVLRDRLAEVGR